LSEQFDVSVEEARGGVTELIAALAGEQLLELEQA
jgi:hypothetical protein